MFVSLLFVFNSFKLLGRSTVPTKVGVSYNYCTVETSDKTIKFISIEVLHLLSRSPDHYSYLIGKGFTPNDLSPFQCIRIGGVGYVPGHRGFEVYKPTLDKILRCLSSSPLPPIDLWSPAKLSNHLDLSLLPKGAKVNVSTQAAEVKYTYVSRSLIERLMVLSLTIAAMGAVIISSLFLSQTFINWHLGVFLSAVIGLSSIELALKGKVNDEKIARITFFIRKQIDYFTNLIRFRSVSNDRFSVMNSTKNIFRALSKYLIITIAVYAPLWRIYTALNKAVLSLESFGKVFGWMTFLNAVVSPIWQVEPFWVLKPKYTFDLSVPRLFAPKLVPEDIGDTISINSESASEQEDIDVDCSLKNKPYIPYFEASISSKREAEASADARNALKPTLEETTGRRLSISAAAA